MHSQIGNNGAITAGGGIRPWTGWPPLISLPTHSLSHSYVQQQTIHQHFPFDNRIFLDMCPVLVVQSKVRFNTRVFWLECRIRECPSRCVRVFHFANLINSLAGKRSGSLCGGVTTLHLTRATVCKCVCAERTSPEGKSCRFCLVAEAAG